jgi:polyferredoxin
MEQVGRARGLIDYATREDAGHDKADEAHTPLLKTLFRPRTILYFSAWGAVGIAMLFAVGTRSRLDLSALQDRNPLYVQLSDGSVRNNYTIKIRNMQSRPRNFEITLVGLNDAVMWTNAGDRKAAGQRIRTTVPADRVAKLRVFIAASGEGPKKEQFDFSIRALDKEGSVDSEDAFFERPGN